MTNRVRRSWAERVERAWLSATNGQYSARPVYSVPPHPIRDGLYNLRRAVRELGQLLRMLYSFGQGEENPRQASTSAGDMKIKG